MKSDRGFPGARPVAHGGSLGEARRLFPDAPEPFIDLSTGINPHGYRLPALPVEAFTRLPERQALDRLAEAAARVYGAPAAEHVVPGPGTQLLLPAVASLVEPGRAAILGVTYAEHARIAELAGHAVIPVETVEELGDADLAIVVNPNNPDGRRLTREALLAVAEALRARGGLLMVDEAFMDVGPAEESVAADVARGNIAVLRSFGKFFGLAGIRLGFALAAFPLAARLGAALGPWPVSGPAIAVGEVALADEPWMTSMRRRLATEAEQLGRLLGHSGLAVLGGTSLFQLAATASAAALFDHLGRGGILVRRFDEQPTWLRFGLPPDEAAWDRLAAALASFD